MNIRMLLGAVCALGFASIANASTWIPGSTGGWSSAASWQGGVPGAGSTVEVPEGADLPVTDADMAIAGTVGEIKLGEGSTVTFTLNADGTYTGKITGGGTIVKDGAKTLQIESTGSKDYYVKGGIRVLGGTFKCPQVWDASFHSDSMSFGDVYVAEGATFHTCGQNAHTYFSKLTGMGMVVNYTYCTKTYQGWPMRLEPAEQYAFEGIFDGYISLQIDAPVDFLSKNSSSTGGASIYLDRGDVGVMSFGNGHGKSSIGLNYDFWEKENLVYKPFVFNSLGRIRYLGTGETSDRQFCLNADYPATIDAGTNGNLVLNGKVYSKYGAYTTLVLSGSNTAESVLSGEFVENDDWSTAIVKRGPGVWMLSGGANRQNAGLVAVEEGTLRFDTLTEVGTPCSFGLSTKVRQPWTAPNVEPPSADYALLLGSADAEGVLEYVGERYWETTCDKATTATRPIAVTGKGGRLVADAQRAIGFRGAFAADEAGAKLTLAGETPNSVLYDVTDNHGPMSVAKEGAGQWTLGGDLTFSGKLTVKEGTLVVSSLLGKSYTWYRFTITKSNIWAYREKYADMGTYYMQLRELVLSDAAGARVNRGVTGVADRAIPQPGEASVWQAKVSDGTSDAIYKLFDGDPSGKTMFTTLCGTDFARPDAASTWIPVVLRVPAGTSSATSYDLVTREYQYNPWDIQCWKLEASTDGVFWDTVADVNSDEVIPHAKGGLWYSSGDAFSSDEPHTGYAFGLDNGKSLRAGEPDQLAHAAVSVAPGATLKAEGSVKISKLELAPGGAGTIDGFELDEAGTINLTGVERLTASVAVPVTFANVTGAESVANWSVTLGNRRSHAKASYADGKITIDPPGLAIIIR